MTISTLIESPSLSGRGALAGVDRGDHFVPFGPRGSTVSGAPRKDIDFVIVWFLSRNMTASMVLLGQVRLAHHATFAFSAAARPNRETPAL
jgi:hypothetical protein